MMGLRGSERVEEGRLAACEVVSVVEKLQRQSPRPLLEHIQDHVRGSKGSTPV